MKTYKVKVCRQVAAEIFVEAENEKDACAAASEMSFFSSDWDREEVVYDATPVKCHDDQERGAWKVEAGIRHAKYMAETHDTCSGAILTCKIMVLNELEPSVMKIKMIWDDDEDSHEDDPDDDSIFYYMRESDLDLAIGQWWDNFMIVDILEIEEVGEC